MVLARYLAARDPRFMEHLEISIERGAQTGLDESDLAFLRTIRDSLRAAAG